MDKNYPTPVVHLCRVGRALNLLSGRHRTHVVGPHHLVVFVRENMTVPGVAPGLVESHLDASDLTR
jgi:hypothetical protein